MTDIWSYLKTADKPILLYGTGNGADRILDELERLGIKVSGVFAGDGFVRDRVFRGFHVTSYESAKNAFGEFIVLMAFGSSRPEVIENVMKIKAEQEFYSVDVPVYGDNIFNIDFARRYKKEIEAVYNSLYDEKSKNVYENVVMFKLTGRPEYLFDCQTDRREAFDNILKLTEDEYFVDLGAFTGDTVNEFISQVDGYKKITAVEPDIKNYGKLVANTSHCRNIECLNVCISDKKGSIMFSKHGGRNGSADKKGVEIPCDTLDNILCGEKATYIKYDVEGLEKEAITGSFNTIKTYKPKLLVSCYHRSEDIFALPLQIVAIRSDYKIHIRHEPYLPAWDTQFYFV